MRRLQGRLEGWWRTTIVPKIEETTFYRKARRDRRVIVLTLGLLGWLVCVKFLGLAADDGIVILAGLLAMTLVFSGLSAGPSIFDGLFEDRSWRTSVRQVVFGGLAALIIVGAVRIPGVADDLESPARRVLGGYDRDVAMLTLLFGALTLLLLGVIATLSKLGLQSKGRSRRILGDAVLPFAGLMVGAVQGAWFPMAVLWLLSMLKSNWDRSLLRRP
ncbi:hypothetical protein [Aeromicrobium piscarium]|uniref:Uncharacterized protein n=1 Tax=Aeromicrobium piscarium TaxID=2590901 RepID=A0A554RHE7_9ACTN|nr:hypothetical protein [Aeromicrobium piscarium]TSD53583.1 hypothetical protein FNM00_18125 [Aeromicrobium piscarium]